MGDKGGRRGHSGKDGDGRAIETKGAAILGIVCFGHGSFTIHGCWNLSVAKDN